MCKDYGVQCISCNVRTRCKDNFLSSNRPNKEVTDIKPIRNKPIETSLSGKVKQLVIIAESPQQIDILVEAYKKLVELDLDRITK